MFCSMCFMCSLVLSTSLYSFLYILIFVLVGVVDLWITLLRRILMPYFVVDNLWIIIHNIHKLLGKTRKWLKRLNLSTFTFKFSTPYPTCIHAFSTAFPHPQCTSLGTLYADIGPMSSRLINEVIHIMCTLSTN